MLGSTHSLVVLAKLVDFTLLLTVSLVFKVLSVTLKVETSYVKFGLLISQGFALKFVCDITDDLVWITNVVINLFLHEAGDIFPRVKFEVFVISEVG